MKKNKTWSPNRDFYFWEYLQGIHGDRYRIDFIGVNEESGDERSVEVSAGTTVKFEVEDEDYNTTTTQGASLSTKHTIKYTSSDLNLGGDIIYYCDKANSSGETYSTGLFEFNIKEKDCN